MLSCHSDPYLTEFIVTFISDYYHMQFKDKAVFTAAVNLNTDVHGNIGLFLYFDISNENKVYLWFSHFILD